MSTTSNAVLGVNQGRELSLNRKIERLQSNMDTMRLMVKEAIDSLGEIDSPEKEVVHSLLSLAYESSAPISLTGEKPCNCK